MSKKYSFLIQAKHVFDGKQKSTYEGFLCLKDKQIVKMGKGKASQKIQEEAEEILEFDKELVMPGVTDTHTFFTGYAVFHLGVDNSVGDHDGNYHCFYYNSCNESKEESTEFYHI